MAAQTMRKFFNSKIKILLLILIWTLIWRQRQYVRGMAAVTAVPGDSSAEIGSQPAAPSDGNLHSFEPATAASPSAPAALGSSTVAALHNNMTAHNPAGLSRDNERVDVVERVAQDQLGGINKTLSIEPSVAVVPAAIAAFADAADVSGASMYARNKPLAFAEAAGTDESGSSSGSSVSKRSKRNLSHSRPLCVYPDGNGNTLKKNNVSVNDDDVGDNIKTKMAVAVALADQYNNEAATLKSAKTANKMTKRMPLPTDAMDMTAILLEQLIYEFAIKYKQIPRLTYFTCHRATTAEHRKYKGNSHSNNNDDDDDEKYNMAYNDDNDKADEPNDRRRRRTVSLNRRTMKMLKRMFATTSATTTTASTESSKAAVAEPTPPTHAKGASSNSSSYNTNINANKNENGNGNANGDDDDDVAAKTRASSDSADADIGVQRPFLTQRETMTTVAASIAASASSSSASASSPSDQGKKSFLIKVMQIDQLINEECTAQRRRRRPREQRCSPLRQTRNVTNSLNDVPNIDTGRRPNGTTNWLEAVLRPNKLRQVVVLDLSCGAASRKLLQMASSRALFSSAYHWLLIEDYAFNRQTGNGNDDDDDNGNSGAIPNGYGNSNGNGNNNKNNANIKNNGCNNDSEHNNKKVANKTPQQPNSQAAALSAALMSIDASAKLSLNNIENVVTTDNRQCAPNANTKLHVEYSGDNMAAIRSSVDGNGNGNSNIGIGNKGAHRQDDDVDDMQIIEKFLEKINININTELILAKRVRGRLSSHDSSDDSEDSTATDINSSSDDSNKPLQSGDYYRLYDVWNPGLHYGGQLNISEIGQFAFDDGFQIAPQYRRSSTVARRTNMQRARIRSMMAITNTNRTDSLEHYLTTYYDTHVDSMNRFQYQLLSYVRDMFNFSLITTSSTSWGYRRNGKFDGMVGAVARKQADICGSPLFFRLERAKVIDYTARTWVSRPCFIFRHPRNTKTDGLVFLQPFESNIWILLLVFGVFATMLLWLLTIFEKKYKLQVLKQKPGEPENATLDHENLSTQRNAKRCCRVKKSRKANANCRTSLLRNAVLKMFAFKTTKGKTIIKHMKRNDEAKVQKCSHIEWSDGQNIRGQCNCRGVGRRKLYFSLLLDSVLFYIGSICQQGLAFSTRFVSGRCVVITSLFFAFAIFQFYSASIVGTLLMERPKTIRTIPDLTHSSFEVGVEDLPYNRDFFRRTKDPEAMELYVTKMVNADEDDNASNIKGNSSARDAKEKSAPVEEQAKTYRDILHSHVTGAHSAPSARTNWFEPLVGLLKMQKGKFAFHVDVATAYKIIGDTFSEREICDLSEIQLYPTQNMVGCVQKGSPLREMITYGLRRVIESGLMDYQRKVWHSPKPRCVKRIHTDDLHVDMETMQSALALLGFGFALSISCFFFEILHYRFYNH